MKNTNPRQRCLLTVALITLVVGASAYVFSLSTLLARDSNPVTLVDEQIAARADGLSDAFRQAARVVQPSVVSISSEKEFRIPGNSRGEMPQIPEEFRRFFGDDFERFFERPTPDQRRFQRGFGSGVVVSRDGYILTNNHVVAGADNITVKLQDESTHKAKVVGTDPKTEVAVIKIEANDMTVARLADSDGVRVGDWVLAIGGPFGLENTITAGIVSAKGRDTVGITDYENFIQTDAAINPGNSGGPLINMRGEVSGINTAIATRSGANSGVGFAIPSNMARMIMEALIKDGRVERGFLGAMIQNLTPQLAESFGFEAEDGVLIGDVSKDGPAEKAGLKPGDIITNLDGKPMKSASQLRNTIAATPPGSAVDLKVFREGRTFSKRVKLGELDGAVTATDEVAPSSATAKQLGLTVRTLTAELANQLGYDEDQAGVVITDVDPSGMANQVGLRPNDVIVSLNAKAVTSAKVFQQELDKQDLEKGIRMQVMSNGVKRFVFIKSR